MKRLILMFVLILVIAVPALSSVDNYYVSGTITPDATGPYFFVGANSGRPNYKNRDGTWYLWNTVTPNYWVISHTVGDFSVFYWIKPSSGVTGVYNPQAGEGTAVVFDSLYNRVNQNPDCKIAFDDFTIFSKDWMRTGTGIASDFDNSGTVDVFDLEIFTDYWLFGNGAAAPVIQSESFSLLKNTSHAFDVNAFDVNALTYTVESLPTKGAVYDSYDIHIVTVPYNLPDKTIRYVAGDYNDVCDSFIFAANDNTGYSPPCGGKITATASVFILSGKPLKATNPIPGINSINIAVDSNLSWTGGAGTSSHLVYLGTSNPPDSQKEQDGNSFDPDSSLVYDSNYYWRIDERNPNGVTTGDIWHFSTISSPTPPVAFNVNTTIYTFETSTIALQGIDDGQLYPPGQLSYIILSLPDNAVLQDPCSGSGIIDGNMLPYMLSFYGDTVWFATESNSSPRTFTFEAYDGNAFSNTATVTITIQDHPRDLLSFDGLGVVEFNDSNYYDVNNGWAIDFWVRTREPFAGLLNKRDSNQGWEIGITSGKPNIYIYDFNCLVVAEARGFYRIDDGQWHEVAFNFNQDAAGIYLAVQMSDIEGQWEFSQFIILGEFDSFDNDCNLQLGFNSKQGYRGDIDMVRFFAGIEDPTAINGIIQGFLNRDGSGFELWLDFGRSSTVRFPMNEGSGLAITDDKLGYTGTLQDPNHVRWYPFYWPFEDVSVQQSYRRNP